MADVPESGGWIVAGIAAAGVAVGSFFTWLGQRLTGKAAQADATTRRFEALFEAQAETIRAERQTHREMLAEREVAFSKIIALLQGQIAALLRNDPAEAERLRVQASMSALVILPPSPPDAD